MALLCPAARTGTDIPWKTVISMAAASRSVVSFLIVFEIIFLFLSYPKYFFIILFEWKECNPLFKRYFWIIRKIFVESDDHKMK